MSRSPNIPAIIALPSDTTATDALLRDVLDVLKDHKAYQLAALEQQDQIYYSLNELNRSLLIDRERRHSEVQELSLEVEGLREDLNRFFVDPRSARGTQRTMTGTGRRPSLRHRRVQTPRPRRQSPSLDESDDDLDAEPDPNLYRYSAPAVPVRRSYTPAPTHPGIPSVTTGSTIGTSRRPTPSDHLRPESQQQSSQGSSQLTYVSEDPVIPPPPPGFVPYPVQDPLYHQNNLPTPRVPFQQSPLHLAPVPPPPQMEFHRHRASNSSQSD